MPAATRFELDLAVGIVACLQTHGSRANWHPHLHLLVTDGGFRPDGTFESWPAHDTARLTEAFRRAVLRLFVRLALFDYVGEKELAAIRHAGADDMLLKPYEMRDLLDRLARVTATRV